METVQPECAKCGSRTGVLGDIGQGTRLARQLRSAAAKRPDDDVQFECLRCGEVTQVRKMRVLRPGCQHCGSKDGVVVDGA